MSDIEHVDSLERRTLLKEFLNPVRKVVSEMSDHPLSSDALLNSEVSRRPFLKTIGGLGLVLLFHRFFTPELAQAEEWIDVGPHPGDLNQKEYFPFDKAVARDRGLVQIDEIGGPLDLHDEVLGHHGPKGHALEWQQDYNNGALRRNPTKRSWLGLCDAVANVMAFHIPLPISKGEILEFEGLNFNLTDIIGINTVKQAHDARLSYMTTESGIKAVLKTAINKGWSPVGNIPGAGREGQVWSWVIKKIRSDLEFVTAYGFGQVLTVSAGSIKGIYLPYYYNPKDEVSALEIDEKAKNRASRYFNPELNHYVVDQITLNLPIS